MLRLMRVGLFDLKIIIFGYSKLFYMKLQPLYKLKYIEILIHVIFWGVFFFFPFIFTQQNKGTIDWNDFLRHSIVPTAFILIFYLNYLLFIPYLLFKEKKWLFFVLNMLAIGIMTFVLRALNELYFPLPPNMPEPPKTVLYLRDAVSLVFAVGLSVAVRVSSQWRKVEAARQEAEKRKTEAELKNLRNQLNPHFLLNTLNNIYALTAFDTERAQQAIQDLSKLLRYVLYDNQQMYVPLCKEVDFIKNYIELMRIRIAGTVNLRVRFLIDPDSQTPIAPLLFISLIENAFKHGISPVNESYIYISIEETENKITCSIMNSYYPKKATDKSGSGIGLQQVKQRLEIMYPGQYEWDSGVLDGGKGYQSVLTIYLKKHEQTN